MTTSLTIIPWNRVLAKVAVTQQIKKFLALLGYGLNDRGSRVLFPAGMGIFLFTNASRTALGPTQPPIQGVPGVLSLGVKRPGREAIPPLSQYPFTA
jgi:hypothetical protein